jgi:hypothetical protein
MALKLSTLDGTNGFRIGGIDAFDNSGISVSSAGDVNGDGVDDIIIGASSADPGGSSQEGETYVVLCRTPVSARASISVRWAVRAASASVASLPFWLTRT